MKRLSVWITVFLLLYTFADISVLLSFEETESFDNQTYCRLAAQDPISPGTGEKAIIHSSFSDSKQCACPLPYRKPLAGDDDCLSCSLFLTADNYIDYPAPAVAVKFKPVFLIKFLQPDSLPKSFFRPPRRV